MAEKIVSPGVFTNEKDLSFIAQGVSEIGAAVIGPIQKGPALVPITVETLNDFYARCGYSSLKTYVPRTVEGYLSSAGVVTVVRVLGNEGYGARYTSLAANADIVAILSPTSNAADTETSASIIGISGSDSFVLDVEGTEYSCSLLNTSPNYITKVFGTDPLGSKPLYVTNHFGVYTSESYSAGNPVTASYATVTQSDGFDHGVTPWVQSQTIAGSKYNLFKFHTLGDGAISNREVKVGISEIKPGTLASDYYGSFTVLVRLVNGTFGSQDLDRRPEVVETFSNVNVNPNSSNYIAKVIGDRYTMNQVVDGANRVVSSGSFANNSRYIRIDLASNIETMPPEVVPYGFAAPVIPVGATFNADWYNVPYVTTQSIDGAYDARRFYGFNYENADSLNYLTNVPNGSSVTTQATFSLDDITVDSDLSGAPYYGSLANVTGSAAQRKFIVPFQYGFDGLPPTRTINVGADITNTNVYGYDCSGAATNGSLQYKKALDAVANAEEIDINLLVVPGIIHGVHTAISTYGKNLCETRGDCFYIMDTSQYSDTVSQIINNVEANELDSNYIATYYPWVKVIESNTTRDTWVPPSVVMPSVFAFNDRVAYEWFAPAGLNRGGLTDVIEPKTKLNHTQRDDLYDARINPIAFFPGQGVVAWGQKTLQIKASALDRINVRRLLINLKKFVASSSRYIVFEANTSATRNRFLNIVNPYLSSVQQKSGLYAFKVVMDETNNTPDIIDRNILYGQIYLQPTKTAEFIVIDFNILPTGAEFPSA